MRKTQKIFPTPVSGIAELMFDAGFIKYKIYCAKLGSSFPQIAPATIETCNMLFMMNE